MFLNLFYILTVVFDLIKSSVNLIWNESLDKIATTH